MKPACDGALSSSSKSFEKARTTLILAHSLHLHRQGSVKHHCQAVPQRELVRKAVVSSLFTFMYFRSSTRRRFPLQFDLIVINGGTDKIF